MKTITAETVYYAANELIDLEVNLWNERAEDCQANIDYRGQAECKQAVIALLNLQILLMEKFKNRL